jgi:hypothetical protein
MGWMTRVLFLTGAGTFFLHHLIQISCGAHPASYLIGTGGFFWGKINWGMKLTTHLHLVPRLRICGAVPPLLHTSLLGVVLN